MSGPLQVEFFFSGPPLNDSGAAARTDYAGFNLNGIEYKVGDCAFLYPEDEGVPPYVARILGVYHDRSGSAADPHCVLVSWFERRAHLEPVDSQCPNNWDREVVALEETDVNPIGCISGKAVVFQAGGYEEASRMAKSISGVEWFFCRGVYKANENSIVPYPELEQADASNCKRAGKRPPAMASGHTEVVADSDEVKRQRVVEEQPAAPVRRTGKLVSGRTCVECGATQTPQWREGPAGPKTLCNACGVRYVRAQQRANKRAAPVGGQRGSCGGGGRQSRTSKAAKADAAAARAARATAAAAGEEGSQRPLRQAALMAASKTAQYARTGVFPQDAGELQPYDNGISGLAFQQHSPPPQPPPQQSEAAAAVYGGFGMLRPATPNCSSYDSSGSLQEGGVTVEVVVGPADGDGGDCCAAARSQHCAAATAAAASLYPLTSTSVVPPSVAASALSPATQPSAMVQVQPSVAPYATSGIAMIPAHQQPAAMVAVAPVVAAAALIPQGQMAGVPQPHPAAPSPTVAGAAAAAAAVLHHHVPCGPSIPPASLPEQTARAVFSPADAADCHRGLGDAPGCFVIGSGGGCSGPALSGGPAAHCGVGGCGAASAVESPAAQVVSVPVSPSARGGFGCGHLDDGGDDVHLMDNSLHSMYHVYGGELGGGMGAGLEDEYGPLVEVEVDFGLGPASAIGDAGFFGELHDHGVVDGDDGSSRPQQLDPAHPSDEGTLTLADLPEVAARAAAFCPDLAPGSDARQLLDAMPVLLQQQQQQASQSSQPQDPAAVAPAAAPAAGQSGAGCGAVGGIQRSTAAAGSAFAAAAMAEAFGMGADGGSDDGDGNGASDGAAAAIGSRVPSAAVEQLLSVSRQASRASTDAMVADAALQAVSQVLEVHQEASRRAREAALTNLGRLRDCISNLAGGSGGAADGAAAAAVAEMGSQLIDIDDLGGMVGLPGAGGGCSFDGGEFVVAVHS